MSLPAIAAIHGAIARRDTGLAAVGAKPCVMTTKDEPDRRLSALITALSLNRGELDAAALERLLGLIEASQPSPAKS